MTNLHDLKKQKQEKVNSLLNEVQVFWAFSTEQFKEGHDKLTLQKGDKLVSIGAGGFMPKSKVDAFIDGMKAINKWFKSAVKDNKVRRENIIYELGNHEAWYTGELEDTLNALGSDYTLEEVREVYNKEYVKQCAMRD